MRIPLCNINFFSSLWFHKQPELIAPFLPFPGKCNNIFSILYIEEGSLGFQFPESLLALSYVCSIL